MYKRHSANNSVILLFDHEQGAYHFLLLIVSGLGSINTKETRKANQPRSKQQNNKNVTRTIYEIPLFINNAPL